MLAFQYIDDDASLAALVAQYRETKLLVIDTEFVRTRTYYARLGLIQAYDGKTLALIDPVAVSNLSLFWSLLTDDNIIKLLHSCSEDLEVFANNGGCQPNRLFDSQIAAGLCGMGYGLGYAKLVDQTLDIKLDKGESRTDWLKRPLTEAQLSYAANDVYYLYELYPQLVEKLESQGRLDWVYEDGERMTLGRLDAPAPEVAYLKVKNAFQLLPRQLAVLKALASWRLNRALVKDLALGFVVKDHALIALAKKMPKTSNELYKMTEVTEQEKRIHGKDILNIIENVNFDDLPKALDVLALKTGYKAAFKSIKQCIAEQAEAQDVPIEQLGSKKLIHEYLEWVWDGKKGKLPLVLSGWRKTVVSDALNALAL
ncbi:ribonuclease D [Shewanella sp. Choline-02u-19]|uniref:ribonuclease D n=1 Tax=unclassified Shewanella TaxID=196818 RepID=UPI000C3360C5|nr:MULTISPECIES: ribonuclease D [unclassified Shewanella]PKG57370.1 ribonuclease D [Shewanella sp. GutDb-MelDb]PKG75441.1 ribonuclease D [Shewanella sp. GutCb]PKH56139.1 ribonuclease D [Shewanella sp. Bg11-22]PKI27294.1 ribonuclease D [Shewanella sp. Choline-02u-19]